MFKSHRLLWLRAASVLVLVALVSGIAFSQRWLTPTVLNTLEQETAAQE